MESQVVSNEELQVGANLVFTSTVNLKETTIAANGSTFIGELDYQHGCLLTIVGRHPVHTSLLKVRNFWPVKPGERDSGAAWGSGHNFSKASEDILGNGERWIDERELLRVRASLKIDERHYKDPQPISDTRANDILHNPDAKLRNNDVPAILLRLFQAAVQKTLVN